MEKRKNSSFDLTESNQFDSIIPRETFCRKIGGIFPLHMNMPIVYFH
ncbi:hypothetical protein BAGQ_0522 [Bacillus velezensis]|nr:hypothetical protein BCBMB205_04660 [Bacillus velezensis]ARZ56791.1 hypothetical protein BAGQ_0522 [Bacillus velezensis]